MPHRWPTWPCLFVSQKEKFEILVYIEVTICGTFLFSTFLFFTFTVHSFLSTTRWIYKRLFFMSVTSSNMVDTGQSWSIEFAIKVNRDTLVGRSIHQSVHRSVHQSVRAIYVKKWTKKGLLQIRFALDISITLPLGAASYLRVKRWSTGR